MSDASDAFAEAERLIAQALVEGGVRLDLGGLEHLEKLPESIGRLVKLEKLFLDNTQVADIAPLQNLSALQDLDLANTQVADITPLQNLTALQSLHLHNTQVADITPLQYLTVLQTLHLHNTQIADITPLQNLSALQFLILDNTQVADIASLQKLAALQALYLRNTQVADLRPLLALPALGDNKIESRLLYFTATPPTAASPELHALSEIEDNTERIDKTLAFLRTLPPYPKPLPWETTTASAEAKETIPPEITTAQTQIAFVLEHAAVSRATAQQTASQIRFALRDVPATDGNRLPPVLQSMENVAAIFERLGTPTPADTDERSDLIKKVAALEAEVAELSKLLADEKEAKIAIEELLKQDGFTANYKKALGTKAGEETAALPKHLGIATLIYYLGQNNPAVVALLKALGLTPT